MNLIPKKLKEELAADPEYKFCARAGPDCSGRITWEHAITYAGRQMQERWAIIPLCVYHHLGSGLNKEINRWIALCRANDEDVEKYPRAGFGVLRKFLIKKYGVWRGLFAT